MSRGGFFVPTLCFRLSKVLPKKRDTPRLAITTLFVHMQSHGHGRVEVGGAAKNPDDLTNQNTPLSTIDAFLP